MRLAWFTPYDRRSAIGRFSASVVRELTRLASVDIWHPPTRDPLPSITRLRSFRSSADVPGDISGAYDIAVYNLGNFLPFHADIYEISQRYPGICILHDLVMQDFFLAYFLERLKQPSAYEEAMALHYGEPGRKVAREILGGKASAIFASSKVLDFPLFEHAVQNAYGVITHSVWAGRRVEETVAGLVRTLFLPYEVPKTLEGVEAAIAAPAGRIMAVTAGAINPHKRVDAVIRVLGEHGDLRERLFYRVVGPIEEQYRRTLMALVQEYNLHNIIQFCGHVSDEKFAACLRGADICVNLRWPTTEAASASLVEQMLYAKPVIVSNAGFYSELPDDCVCKVSPACESVELARALRNLVRNGELRQQLGRNGKRFAEEHFQASSYAKAVLDFSWEVRSCKPLLDVADRIGRELASIGVPSTAEFTYAISTEAWTLFGGSTEANGSIET